VPDKPTRIPPVRLIRAVERVRAGLQRLNQSLVPGNIALLDLANGSWTTQSLYVAAKLGIADQLADGPSHAGEVAQRVGADADALYRLMRALAGKGVFRHRRDGKFALTPIGEALRSDAAGSMRNMVLFLGDPAHWEHWGSLLHSVRTGEPAVAKLRGASFFDYLNTNTELATLFHDAMTTMSEMAIDGLLAAYDFTAFGRIVDVGGGHGRLLCAILGGAPDAHGVLYDLPSVVDGATPALEAAGVASRCTVVGGSFLESVPDGGDAYVLKSIIHDWDEDSALRILGNVRTAMPRHGTLLLLEMVLPQRASSHFGTMLDLEMLVAAGGKERTRAEYANLLARTGFRLRRVVDTVGPLSVIEATPG
jgi:hypothetical protein